jgi:hypothetical protein
MSELALRRINNHITSTKRGPMAWYLLPPQRWSFRSSSEREQLIMSGASRYASLIGRRLHLRVTTRPYPVDRWARGVDEAFPNSLPGWAEHLRTEQRRAFNLTLAHKEVYLGVQLHDQRLRRQAALEECQLIDSIMGGPGFDARRVTPQELEYLLHRSVSLGAPAPLTLPPPHEEWDEEDFAQYTDRATWTTRPFDRSVRIVTDVNGEQHVRHVVVLTLGRMQDLDIPDSMEPWLQRSDRLFPVEWSIIADVVETSKVRKELHDTLARIKAQLDHYADHDEIPPSALTRQEERAIQVEDEVTNPNPLHTRVHCWVRAAVSGNTELEALDRAKALTDLYLPQLPLARGADQFRTAREFIPGESLANSGHKRRMPVTTFAAGVPAVASVIGDRAGFRIGSTAGASRRAACWHPWQAMEVRERSGATVVSGTLGSGKSTLLGTIGYWAALAGIKTVILDPSGPLARICTMPELRKYSRAIDLMNAIPGALNPYAVIADPVPEHYLANRVDGMSDEEWQTECISLYRRAILTTQAARRMLCSDTLTSLLPFNLVRETSTQMALTDAARRVPGVQHSSPRDVITKLASETGSNAEHAHYLARTLTDIAELPQAQLIFPEDGREPINTVNDNLVLQVLTMRGNVLPEIGKPREEWSMAETIGIPLMTLGAYLTSRHVYSVDMNVRKLVVLDEVMNFTRVSSGQTLVRELSRDSRKFNLRAIFSGQNVTDSLLAGIENFLDNSFAGRTEGEAEQTAVLRALGIPRGVGYEQVIGSLSPRERQTESRTGFREFIWNDGDDGIEKIRIDVPEALRTVLDTTANPLQLQKRILTSVELTA